MRHADGRLQEFRLHDYEQLYSVPGLYEHVVQERLACRSPQLLAQTLARAIDGVGWVRAEIKVIDLAAGNGVSGESLHEQGLVAVLGLDIVPAARTAALRDRPGVYGDYLTVDLTRLSDQGKSRLRRLGAGALCCAAPVGHGPQLPTEVLAVGAELLTDDAVVVHMHDPALDPADPVTPQLWSERGFAAQELSRRRYVHRQTITGRPYEMEAVAWRLQRR